MEKFKKLLEFGQSYWLDNLTREMIQSGDLRGKIENEGLRGVTSNPTIFQVAISNGNFYDSQISALAGESKDAMEIYEAIVIKDIQDACDLIRPVFNSSHGKDGFISLEVSPYIARDTEATKKEVRKLAKLVSRPNCFIKIPGTPEGLPAIEEMLYEGININITLLFSVSSYEKVAEAFLRALERRLDEGKKIDSINSVASFFLSRIDIMVNKHIENKLSTYEADEAILAGNLLGEAAIASAKMAYQSFLRIFKSERWERLEQKGAHIQRPLWASTSNKIDGYRETRYFEPLIGPDTVNTLPDSTIEAIKKIGKIEENTVLKGIDESILVFKNLETLGINIDDITNHLLVEEGIDKFVKSFDQLLSTIEEKSKQMV